MSDQLVEDVANYFLWTVMSPILLTIGTMGNILSIVVLTRRTSQTSVYLMALSLADILVLNTGLLRQFIKRVSGIDVRLLSEPGCKMHVMTVYSSLHISVWILVAFTCERIISVFAPHKVRSYCTRLTSTAAVAGITCLLLALNSHFVYGMGRGGNHTLITCSELYPEYENFLSFTWPWIDFSVFCLVPCVVLLAGNTSIVLGVLASKRKSRRVGPILEASAQPLPRNKTSSMTAVLLMLNLVFVLTTAPVSLFFILYPSWQERIRTEQDVARANLVFAAVNLFQYLNNALNFLLYCGSGTKFRQDLAGIFRRGQFVIHGRPTTITHGRPTTTMATSFIRTVRLGRSQVY
ncbi:probable G-protein coupled receptor 139 [Physella acuta]|uniref:probable G-protein coupled receptor 139 n=1 Tax=Physella acuta TaxID=109671 RepID=UPI0027DB49BB|nr:probable G-protein coupled receptor 139 [Physella acuta]